jgi:hypothetical protein
MGVVMIKCPNTGRSIATDMKVERSNFEAMPVFFGRTFCPACRVHHEWFAMNAWVCDGPEDGRIDEKQPLHSN